MSDHDLSSGTERDGSRPRMSRRDWEELPADPDPRRDLGYHQLELEVFEVEAGDQLMILPRDEDMVREDAFIIARESSLLDVDAHR